MSPDTTFQTAFETELAAIPNDQFDEERFVPAVGSLDAELVLVGEAPGADEVAQGEPFVGRSGQVLTEVLAELGVEREDVYITNVVKVRPPDNRDPRREEIEAWRSLLEAELDRVDPAVIVTLGNVASRELLGRDVSITEVHGDPVEVDGRTVLPTFHPAATLYDRSKRPAFEADVERAVSLARG